MSTKPSFLLGTGHTAVLKWACRARLFSILLLVIFSGIVRQPVTREDEIHNCQMVVDVLSADVIKDNLSHIRGVDIVEGKVQSINNLLDIFTFLYEYVIKQIESDVPTDTEGDYVLYPYSFFLWSSSFLCVLCFGSVLVLLFYFYFILLFWFVMSFFVALFFSQVWISYLFSSCKL